MGRTVFVLAMLAAIAAPAATAADPLSMRVRRDVRFGSREGTLIFLDDAIEFRTGNEADTRRWAYDKLTRVVIAGPKRLELHTPNPFAWIRFATGDRTSVTLLDGGITPAVADFLLHQIPGSGRLGVDTT